MVEAVAEFQRIEKCCRPFAAFGSGSARINGWNFHILLCGGRGNEVVALENEAKSAAAKRCKLVRIQCRDIFAVEQISPAGRRVETAENVHQR